MNSTFTEKIKNRFSCKLCFLCTPTKNEWMAYKGNHPFVLSRYLETCHLNNCIVYRVFNDVWWAGSITFCCKFRYFHTFNLRSCCVCLMENYWILISPETTIAAILYTVLEESTFVWKTIDFGILKLLNECIDFQKLSSNV